MPRDRGPKNLEREPLWITPIGHAIGDSSVVRHVRCSADAPGVGFICGREKDHDGPHSCPIYDTDRCYVWPRTTITDPLMPEGLVCMVDNDGNVAGVIDLRGGQER